MLTRSVVLFLAVVLLAAAPVLAAPAVDWDSGYVEAAGYGSPPAGQENTPRGTALARRAAVVDAQRNLTEIIQGVEVSGETTVRDLMVENDTVKTKVYAMLRGARVASEKRHPDGTVEVVLRVSTSVLQDAVPQLKPAELPKPVEPYAPPQPNPPPVVQPPAAASPFGQTQQITGKEMTGTIYYLSEGTNALPDFSRLSPVGRIYTNSLDISPRSFEQGFPGVTDRFEWFGIVYTGSFAVSVPGNYTFTVLSDDGAKVYIDGRLVVDNDGVHPPGEESGAVRLDAGAHNIKLEYFQGPRYEIALQLWVIPPGGRKQIFNIDKAW